MNHSKLLFTNTLNQIIFEAYMINYDVSRSILYMYIYISKNDAGTHRCIKKSIKESLIWNLKNIKPDCFR